MPPAATASNMWRFCGEPALYAAQTIALHRIEAFNQGMRDEVGCRGMIWMREPSVGRS
jgi:hypothetical protein